MVFTHRMFLVRRTLRAEVFVSSRLTKASEGIHASGGEYDGLNQTPATGTVAYDLAALGYHPTQTTADDDYVAVILLR